ncbi:MULTISPECIES: recombination regulator RecX [Clostridium]|uniref:Regulatory protein RecX n=1 Tax=Clostridium cibarium TaxID=2762247 RepID=A0ABR8PPQ0_9CLOT|nr:MULTISPECIES: recombination regulator RecX [Clostridium]MBD7910158.1 recombination regulator RecX [Clostridium cibarium]
MAKITRIETQKRNKDRVNIYLDDRYAFAVNAELVYREGLKVNLEVDEEKLHNLSKNENLLKCKETALRIIERSYKTEKEIKEKLREKGYDSEEIIKVLGFLKEYNFINDESYMKMYIKDRLKSQGREKIKYALLRKGIDSDLIEEELNSIDMDEERNIAVELATKKYLVLIKRENDKYKLWNKLCRFLVGKGYKYSIAKEVVQEVCHMEDIN